MQVNITFSVGLGDTKVMWTFIVTLAHAKLIIVGNPTSTRD